MADPPHVMIVEARFYEDIADELVRGAVGVLESTGASHERFAVPGAFEIPSAIQMAIRGRQFVAESGDGHRKFDGYIALGCVIRGETSHYDYVCQESARGLQELALRYGVPLGYGILTVDNREQAWARASLDGRNKGGDVARACLRMIELKREFGPGPG